MGTVGGTSVAEDQKSWLARLFERPAWKRAGQITEEAAADFYATAVLMMLIFLAHGLVKLLKFDQTPIGFGYHMADIFTLLHVCNIVINGGYAIYRLIQVHRSHDE